MLSPDRSSEFNWTYKGVEATNWTNGFTFETIASGKPWRHKLLAIANIIKVHQSTGMWTLYTRMDVEYDMKHSEVIKICGDIDIYI